MPEVLGIGPTHITAEGGGGRLVRVARERSVISQAELSRRLGVPQQTVARWESGRREPSFANVLRAVGACGWDLIAVLALRQELDASLRQPAKLRSTPSPAPATLELLGIDGRHGGERRLQGLAMLRKRRAALRARSEVVD
ncbi:MAG: helix-turn-helix transcriptional regulator [Actinobacteria bacterium]|nr:helix-turn-helix transcriptional regulator [Actinomycetota bacterium]